MKRIGYGQVEPNHLSAQRTSQIYAQLPAHIDKNATAASDNSIKLLENGQFVKYDYENGEVNFSGDGEWMLVFNEIKLYDGWREMTRDFALINTNYTEKVMTPRVFKTNIGDIYTTNCLEKAGAKGVETTMTDVAVGALLAPNANGYLEELAEDADSDIIFKVVKLTTMPDGQDAVKVQRIK